MVKKRLYLSLMLGVGLLLSTATNAEPLAANNVIVRNPMVSLAATNNNQASISMVLNNKAENTNYVIIAATSSAAKQVQLGKTIRHGKNMKAVKEIIVDADASRTLQADDLHIALIGLKQQLHAGDTVPVTLIFADGSYLDFRATVNKATINRTN